MKKIITLVCALLLVGCSGATETPGTPDPAQVAMTMLSDKVNAEATQARLEIVFSATAQILGATATQQAYYAQATSTQQARNDANATAAKELQFVQLTQARIDADSTQAQARLDADATAEQARLDLVATQQAIGTATAFAITQTAIPPANTNTAIALVQDIQIKQNQVELSNLEVEQQRQKNTPEWVVPMLVVLVGLAAGVMYLKQYSRVREVKNDDGDIELILVDNRALRPQLLPGPVLEFVNGAATMPLLTSAAEQSRVTERAQAVDAIKAMPATGTTPQAAGAFMKFFGPGQEPPFDVIDADDAPPAGLLDGEAVKSLEKDWKEAKDGK